MSKPRNWNQLKIRILQHIAEHQPCTMKEVSLALNLAAGLSGMSLIRYYRQGLLARSLARPTGRKGRTPWMYWLAPKKGVERLAYLAHATDMHA